ncbi:MAG TPA: GNAT family protein [Verrucomicrobiae bacterium]|nr:GNAT family protein [Verrucomicrobiae bacterium]
MQTTFTGASTGIRPFQPSDIDLLFAAARESLKDLSPWLPWCHMDYSISDSKSWVMGREAAWEKSEEYSFVIFEVKSGAFLGGVGLHHINKLDRCANVGYWVRTSRTGQGIAPAAVRMLANFGFQELNLNRLEIIIGLGNKASQRVAEKVGAKREGLLRKRIWLDGAAHNALLYSLVPEDLDA